MFLFTFIIVPPFFHRKNFSSEKESYTLLPVCHSSFTFSERIGVSSTIILLIDDCCNGVCNCSIGRMFPMIIKTNKIIYTSKNPRIAPQTHLLALKPVFLQTYLTNYQVMKVQFCDNKQYDKRKRLIKYCLNIICINPFWNRYVLSNGYGINFASAGAKSLQYQYATRYAIIKLVNFTSCKMNPLRKPRKNPITSSKMIIISIMLFHSFLSYFLSISHVLLLILCNRV